MKKVFFFSSSMLNNSYIWTKNSFQTTFFRYIIQSWSNMQEHPSEKKRLMLDEVVKCFKICHKNPHIPNLHGFWYEYYFTYFVGHSIKPKLFTSEEWERKKSWNVTAPRSHKAWIMSKLRTHTKNDNIFPEYHLTATLPGLCDLIFNYFIFKV